MQALVVGLKLTTTALGRAALTLPSAGSKVTQALPPFRWAARPSRGARPPALPSVRRSFPCGRPRSPQPPAPGRLAARPGQRCFARLASMPDWKGLFARLGTPPDCQIAHIARLARLARFDIMPDCSRCQIGQIGFNARLARLELMPDCANCPIGPIARHARLKSLARLRTLPD